MPYLPRLFGRPACFPHLLSPSLYVVSAPRAGLRPARPPRGSRKLGAARRFLVTLALLALAGCGERAASSGASAKGAKPPEVGVVEVKTRDVPLELDLPGRQLRWLVGSGGIYAENCSACVIRVAPGEKVRPAHCHPQGEELIYLLSGEGRVLVNGEVSPVRAGSMVRFPTGHIHMLHNTGESEMKVVCFFAPGTGLDNYRMFDEVDFPE